MEAVRIRDTFIAIGGVRLHTIEPIDVRAQVSRSEAQGSEVHPAGARRTPRSGGIAGLSFAVPDIEAAHARAAAEGLRPTRSTTSSPSPNRAGCSSSTIPTASASR